MGEILIYLQYFKLSYYLCAIYLEISACKKSYIFHDQFNIYKI